MAKEKLLSVRETSERLNLPEKKIRNMIREGKIPCIRIGYNLAISEHEVLKLALELK